MILYLDLENGADITRDESKRDFTTLITNNGGGTIDATQTKFGNYALVNTGSITRRIAVNNSAGTLTEFNFGAGPFTVEGWARWTSTVAANVEALCGNNAASPNFSWHFGKNASNNLAFTYSLDGTTSKVVSAAFVPTIGQWYYLAVDRDAAGVIRVYLDGVVHASATDAASLFASTNPFVVGNDNNLNRGLPGHIGGVRITKGVARYAGAFTPPATKYPTTLAGDTHYNSTVLLLNFDANGDGTTFSNRWRTFADGATAARLAAGDTVRMMASPDPTLVGNATWTQNSKTVTLAAAVTATIANNETAWTAATNVTAATSATAKQGTNAASITIATAFVTGKAAHFATGALDLSGYEQVSFWIRSSVAIADNATLSLRLCSDTTGDATVHTIPIPAIPAANQYMPVTWNMGAPLSTSIQSIALYCDKDPGIPVILLDNIIACKAASSPDSLTLTSLIGKAHNLSWQASTAYVLNDKRRPTQAMRNGFVYQVTTAGTTGATEPVWPPFWTGTVTDGTVVWTCVEDELEDTWYGIQSIVGTTVLLDNGTNTAANAGRGYSLTTETVATYKRETIKPGAVATSTAAILSPTLAGTQAAPIAYSFGWDRTAMAAQNGETWIDGQNGLGQGIAAARSWNSYANVGFTRCNNAVNITVPNVTMTMLHGNNSTAAGLATNSTIQRIVVRGMVVANGSGTGSNPNGPGDQDFRALGCYGNLGSGWSGSANGPAIVKVTHSVFRFNAASGFSANRESATLTNVVTSANGNSGFGMTTLDTRLVNCKMSDTTPISGSTAFANAYVYSHNHNRITSNHLITTDGGTIQTATDQRNTASGVSWRFSPTAASRDSGYPLILSVAKIVVQSGTPVTAKIWVRRSNTNIKGRMVLPGGQVSGVSTDVAVDCEPTIDTWEQFTLPTFTPTETGVVELKFHAWDGVTTTSLLWIDDFSIS